MRGLVAVLALALIAATLRDRPSPDWTQATLELVAKHRLNPLRAARALALVHVAMHDALVRGEREAADAGLAWIAVHRAASLALADVFTQESPDAFEARGRAAAAAVGGDEARQARMWAVGTVVAAAVAERARRDGSDRAWQLSRRPAASPGLWQPTPPVNAFNPLEPLAGEWTPWVLASGGELEPPVPMAFDGPRFHEELEEVRQVAAALTPEQKAIAEEWNLDRGTVTPAGVWNLKAVALAREAGLSEAESLRVLAVLNVAMADAFVACWHAKYKWWTVRPITVIREREDPKFLSHLVTPPFPSYPSGHASASGAAEVALASFFPAKAGWLRAEAEQAAESRLLGGIHYRSDNDAGLELGRAVGRRVTEALAAQGSKRREILAPKPVAQ